MVCFKILGYKLAPLSYFIPLNTQTVIRPRSFTHSGLGLGLELGLG